MATGLGVHANATSANHCDENDLISKLSKNIQNLTIGDENTGSLDDFHIKLSHVYVGKDNTSRKDYASTIRLEYRYQIVYFGMSYGSDAESIAGTNTYKYSASKGCQLVHKEGTRVYGFLNNNDKVIYSLPPAAEVLPAKYVISAFTK